MRYQRQIDATVLRKGVTHVGGRVGDFAVASVGTTLAYALEIRDDRSQKIETIYLDWGRSKDYYRIPLGQSIGLRVGRLGDRGGVWLDTWFSTSGESGDSPAIPLRVLTPEDVPQWLRLAHHYSDDVIREVVPDPSVFYDGFDEYMERKIRQGEAFMAVDPGTGECMGIIAFSRKRNGITFLAIYDLSDFGQVGVHLLNFALGQLDPKRPVHTFVVKSRHERVAAEMRLYGAHGFGPAGDTVEAGVHHTLMVRPAG